MLTGLEGEPAIVFHFYVARVYSVDRNVSFRAQRAPVYREIL